MIQIQPESHVVINHTFANNICRYPPNPEYFFPSDFSAMSLIKINDQESLVITSLRSG